MGQEVDVSKGGVNEEYSIEKRPAPPAPQKKVEMNASEALFGFAAWLSTRKEKVEIGSGCDCAVWAEFVKKFCEANGLSDPRDGWEKDLKYPKE